MSEIKEVTSKEFQECFVCGPGLILIERDKITEKYGKLIVPRSVVERTNNVVGTGRIVGITPFVGEDPREVYLLKCYKVGDRVAFSSSVPIIAPAPPTFRFKNKDQDQDATILINVADILGFALESKDDADKTKGWIEWPQK